MIIFWILKFLRKFKICLKEKNLKSIMIYDMISLGCMGIFDEWRRFGGLGEKGVD